MVSSRNRVVANALLAYNRDNLKPGDRCKWKNGPFEWKGVVVGGRPGNWKVRTDDGKEQVWHGSLYRPNENYGYTDTPFGRVAL